MRSPTEVAVAMKRAARPVTFSLAIILLVYMPLLALEGVEGRMFRPMAITVGLALAGALAFSLTAFPALAAFVLTAPRRPHDAENGRLGPLERRYRWAAGSSLVAARSRCSAPRSCCWPGRSRWAPASAPSSFPGSTRASCHSTSSGSRRSRSPRRSASGSRSRTCWRGSPRCCRSSPAPAAPRSRPIRSVPTKPR